MARESPQRGVCLLFPPGGWAPPPASSTAPSFPFPERLKAIPAHQRQSHADGPGALDGTVTAVSMRFSSGEGGREAGHGFYDDRRDAGSAPSAPARARRRRFPDAVKRKPGVSRWSRVTIYRAERPFTASLVQLNNPF